MTAEIINLAEYRARKLRRKAFKTLEQCIAESDIAIPIPPAWIQELPNFSEVWIAVDMSCDYKPPEDKGNNLDK